MALAIMPSLSSHANFAWNVASSCGEGALALRAAAQRPGDPGTCYADQQKQNHPFHNKLCDGYEVSLGPARNGEAEQSCTAAIYRADGKVVYRTTGFSVLFD